MTNLPRRDFLRLGAGVIAAAELPRAAWAKRAPLAPLELKPIEIAADASKPFGAVHAPGCWLEPQLAASFFGTCWVAKGEPSTPHGKSLY